MNDDPRIPEPVKQTPTCPLCLGHFERMHDDMADMRLEQMVKDTVARAKECDLNNDKKGRQRAIRFLGLLDASIKAGAAEVFVCHFDKIGIAANDPFVGHWEEAYAKGEKIMCPACDTKMRFFCTSTGFMLAQCPVKACRARMQLSAPDRAKEDRAARELFDDKGDPITLPNINNAISTPDDMTPGQIGGMGNDEDLPDVTTIIPNNPRIGHA